MTLDCVIVGGGLAGLTCANRAAELGLRVLVVEKGAAPDYPCNTRFSGGIVHVAFKDLRAEVSDIEAAIKRLIGDDPATAEAFGLAENGARALAWLQCEGTRFVKGGALEFMRWILAPPRPRRPGLDWKGRGPDVLLRNLTRRLHERGGELRLGARVVDTVSTGAGLAGVVVETAAGRERIAAPAVVIADGGFQGDPDLVREHISPAPEGLFQRGAGTGCGDGLRMALALGADLVGMDRFYGHLLGRGVFENEKLWPYPTVDAIAQASLLVDAGGRRFVDEGLGGVYMANQLAKLADPLSAAVIFDDAVWNGIAADNRYPPCMNPAFVSVGGELLSAPTMGGLGAELGLPGHVLEQTVAQHNEFARNPGSREEAGAVSPPRTGLPVAPQPLETPPYHAIRLCAGITYTMGGVRIDAESRALSPAGDPVAGLYAVGSASGGMEGGRKAAYLGGLVKAVVTGLRAAESLEQARRSAPQGLPGR